MLPWKLNFACENNFKETKQAVTKEFCLLASAKLHPCNIRAHVFSIAKLSELSFKILWHGQTCPGEMPDLPLGGVSWATWANIFKT